MSSLVTYKTWRIEKIFMGRNNDRQMVWSAKLHVTEHGATELLPSSQLIDYLPYYLLGST